MEPEIELSPEYRRTANGGELYSEIEIRSSPELIWKILADFPRYPEWNPFIRSIRGDLVPGGPITADLRPPGSAGMVIRPVLVRVDPPRELRWKGHLFFSGLFDGEHVFEIHPEDTGRCRFVQREIFSGVLLPLFTRMLKSNTAHGFAAMNAALKERAETPEKR